MSSPNRASLTFLLQRRAHGSSDPPTRTTKRGPPPMPEWMRDVADDEGPVGVMTLPLGSREPKPLVVGVCIDRSRIVYFGHSQGSMLLPAAYGASRPDLPFAGVVLFEGLPPDTTGLEPALRNLGVRHVLLVNGQSGWQPRHTALARVLSARGLHAWHVPGTFGHFFNDDALALLLRETPALFEPEPGAVNVVGAEPSKKRIALVTFPHVAR